VQNCVWFEVGRTPLASGAHATAHPAAHALALA
jgi:hypothetical protein